MTRTRLCQFLLLILALGSIAELVPPVAAQEDGERITIGEWTSIDSVVLGEKRRLIVSVPRGYEQSDSRFPVLYLLDGPQHFRHTTGLVDFLATNDLIPKTIVVAIANYDRGRDMARFARDPTKQPTSGGAENFLAFLSKELIPYVDSSYRTQPYRILAGHSLGGLFAIYSLVHQPDLFDAYIAVSPSLQWDKQSLVTQADTFFGDHEKLHKALYMTTGNEGGGLTGGVMKLAGVLTEHSPEEFEWDWRVMPEESHNSVVHRSVRQGLEFVFQHWALREPLTLYDQSGIEGIHSYFEQAAQHYGLPRPVSTRAIMELAGELVVNDPLEQAEDVIEQELKQRPTSAAVIYEMLGEAYADKGDREEAIAAFMRALELNPSDGIAKTFLTELDVDVAAMAFDVPVEALRTYVGTYGDADHTHTVDVAIVDGHLQVSGDTIPTLSLAPVSEHRFAAAGQPLQLSFEMSDDGGVAGFVVEANGRVVRTYQRVDRRR